MPWLPALGANLSSITLTSGTTLTTLGSPVPVHMTPGAHGVPQSCPESPNHLPDTGITERDKSTVLLQEAMQQTAEHPSAYPYHQRSGYRQLLTSHKVKVVTYRLHELDGGPKR